MLEEKSLVLRIVIVLLTIIGAVATVFSCAIAYMAFVNPQRTEIVLKQLASPSSSTPVVITVIAPTPTPYPTYTPYPVPTGTPRATQAPAETGGRTPPPGEIVPAGQPISKGAVSVTLEKKIRAEPGKFGFYFVIENSTTEQIVVRYKPSFIKVADDRGTQYFNHKPLELVNSDTLQKALDQVKQFTIDPGQAATLDPSDWYWNEGYPTGIPFFEGGIDPNADFLIVSIDKLAGMENLQWRYDLD